MRVALPPITARYSNAGSLSVGPIVVGAVDDWRVIGEARDAGVNSYLISAELHWPLYEQTRVGLRDLATSADRESFYVVAVASSHPPDTAPAAWAEALADCVGLRRLDCIIVGGADDETFASRWRVARRSYDVATCGASSVGLEVLEPDTAVACARAGLVDVVLLPLHPGMWRKVGALNDEVKSRSLLCAISASYPRPSVSELLTLSIPSDTWHPSVMDYHRYVLSLPSVHSTVVSGLRCGDLDKVSAGLEAGPLTQEERTHIEELSDIVLGQARA